MKFSGTNCCRFWIHLTAGPEGLTTHHIWHQHRLANHHLFFQFHKWLSSSGLIAQAVTWQTVAYVNTRVDCLSSRACLWVSQYNLDSSQHHDRKLKTAASLEDRLLCHSLRDSQRDMTAVAALRHTGYCFSISTVSHYKCSSPFRFMLGKLLQTQKTTSTAWLFFSLMRRVLSSSEIALG